MSDDDVKYVRDHELPSMIDELLTKILKEKPDNSKAFIREQFQINIRKACICGGGNGAHVFAAVMSSKGIEVNIYTPLEEEVRKWNDSGLKVTAKFVSNNTELSGKVKIVTSDPIAAARDVDIAIVCLPTYLHEETITSIAPHLQEGTPIGTIEGGWWGKPPLPGMRTLTFFVISTLPWAARIEEYGKTVSVLGTKNVMPVASSPASEAVQLSIALSRAIDINMKPSSNLLGMCGLDVTNIIHPGIMYGRLKDWDGTPFETAPLFYQGVDDKTEQIMLTIESDCLKVKDKICQLFPEVDLSDIITTYQWLLTSYSDQIADKSTMRRAFNTNAAYKGLTFPMQPNPNGKGLVPQFNYRYLTADVAIHLMVIRGIAEILDVPTPDLDKVIIWTQQKLGQEWIKNGRVTGKDINKTRAPQKFGIHTIQDLMNSASAESGDR